MAFNASALGDESLAMISDRYRQLNERLHREQHAYGCSGSKHAALVLDVVRMVNAADVLDYGCGKQTLAGMISHVVPCRGYDPALPHVAAEPSPADVVACTDVLEHVEPEHLDAVMAHIFSLTRKAAVFVISCERGGRKLPDGRYAHLIIQPAAWWEKKLQGHGLIDKRKPVSATAEAVFVVFRHA